MNIKCAIYARYSSENQKETSIEDQIRKCREFAFKNGWQILEEHIYFDKAQSGLSTQKREQFNELCELISTGKAPFRYLIVDETSRLSRNINDALKIYHTFKLKNVEIFFVNQGINTMQEFSEEFLTFHALIDNMSVKETAKRTHRGLEGQFIKGFSAGGRHYGYKSKPVYSGKMDIYGNPIAEGYILKINPEEAETVKRIFKLFGEEGYSARRIANLLNKELKETGKPKPPRGDYWRVSTIIGSKKDFRGILNNEIYIGKYTWNKTSSRRNPENGKKKRILKETDKWISILKPELKIISDELWQKVKQRQRYLKEITKGKYTKAKKIYARNLFSGLMTCGICQGNIVIVSGGKYAKYGCSNNWNKGFSVCENAAKIDKNRIELEILQALKLDFRNDKFINYLFKKVNAIIRAKFKENKNVLMYRALKDELKKINREIDNFINAIKAGIITESVKNQLLLSEKRKAEIESKLQNIENEKNDIPQIKKENIEHYLENLNQTLSLNSVLGRDFLNKVVSKIILTPIEDKIKVTIIPTSVFLQKQPIYIFLDKSPGVAPVKPDTPLTYYASSCIPLVISS